MADTSSTRQGEPPATQVWRNWSGYLDARPAAFHRPQDASQLAGIVKQAAGPVRVVGSGHSFSPLVPTTGVIVSLENLSGLLCHDEAGCRATVAAGTPLGELARLLDACGQALPNMGDIDKQTLGGALGTATHGTGPELGAYHTQIEEVELVDGRGEIRRLSRESGMIEAVGVALGVFGIFSEVTIRNVPSYKLRKRRRILPIAEMLADFETMMGAHRSAEFYYIPLSGHALFLASDLSQDAVTVRPPDDDEDGLSTLAALRTWLSWLPWARRKLIANAMAKVPPEDYVEAWLRVYTTERKTLFNEMEYHLPVEEGPKALAEIIALTERDFPDVYFPMEVRTVAADDFWLSPFYKRPTCSIAVHHDAGRDPLAFFRACETIFRKYGGRPHWGKMHNLVASDVEELYPRFREAMEVRRQIDPENRFVTPYIARLLGIS